jgi:hypothetical protein
MSRAARHNLGALFRLAAVLVMLGLGTVPVECAAVYGPHSIFISAEAVSHLRSDDHGHQHGTNAIAEDMPGTAGMAQPANDSAIHEPGSPSSRVVALGAAPRVPTPAGTTVDALIAVALFDTDSAPGPRDFATISPLLPIPSGSLLPAPEPPPPQLAS